MINAVSQQFSKFVSFAEERIQAGKDKAIATKGDILAKGGTTLEERKIVATSKFDWVTLSFLRSGDAKRVNNEARTLFRNTIADMFGGEGNIPDSVKEAMLLKDYGSGKPLTARRIIAVRDAIAALNRVNCFDKTNDPDGALAKKAVAAGYTRLDFGRLNTAANLYVKAKGGDVSYQEAMEQVITKGSAANRAMNAGSIYMKSAEAFGRGLAAHEHVALDDVRNTSVAEANASEKSAPLLSTIAENLAYKFNNILNDAEELLAAANLPHETLDALRAAVGEVAEKFSDVSMDLSTGNLTDRAQIYNKLFLASLQKLNHEVEVVVTGLRDAGRQNPAIEELRQHLIRTFKEAGVAYDKLANTYKFAVARDMAKDAEKRILAAAAAGSKATGTQVAVPKEITDNLYRHLAIDPFSYIKNVNSFCRHLEKYGDANLRFTGEQKADLKALVEQTFGKGPKADKMLQRLIEKFETVFFAEQIISPNKRLGEEPPTYPAQIVNHFKKQPDALLMLDPGLKLDTDDEVAAAKSTIKNLMLADLNAKLADPDKAKITSLSSGLMPQAVREYGRGYVTFKGEPIPNAELGTKFPQLRGESDTVERKGYAEFLERTFDDAHKKMRQIVSFTCAMSCGLGGTIDAMIDEKGAEDCIKGVPRAGFRDEGNVRTVVSSANLLPEENYNIEIADNGDVKITLTHFIQNQLNTLLDMETGVCLNTRTLIPPPNDAPVIGTAKFVVTVTIKNASDEELGEGMPEFTIDDITQEELD